jgi:hypothetical protein
MIPVVSDFPPGAVIIPTGVLARYNTFWVALSRLRVPAGSVMLQHDGASSGRNRNQCLEDIIAQPEIEWAFLLDDDHEFTPTILLDMLKAAGGVSGLVADRNALAAAYCLKLPPFEPVWLTDDEANIRPAWTDLVDAEGRPKAIELAVCGGAGLLLPLALLREVPRPWFNMMDDAGSPDVGFCRAWRAAGHHIIGDPQFVLGHTMPMTAWPRLEGGAWQVDLRIKSRALTIPAAALAEAP